MQNIYKQSGHWIMSKKYFDGVYIYELVWIKEWYQTIYQQSQDLLESMKTHSIQKQLSLLYQKFSKKALDSTSCFPIRYNVGSFQM